MGVGWGGVTAILLRQKLLGEDGSVRWGCRDPGHKFGCDMVHAQFFRQNTLACAITNSHLRNVMNGPTSTLTDELLNSCNSFKRCAACGSPCVFAIANHVRPVFNRE
jgi:hypothetical protein